MDPQKTREALSLYIKIQAEMDELSKKFKVLKRQRENVSNSISCAVPESFVFPCDGRFYSFLMDVEEGGIINFKEIEDLDAWFAQSSTNQEDT